MRGLGRPKESLHLKNQWLKFERLGRAFRPAQGRSLSEQAQSKNPREVRGDGVPRFLYAPHRGQLPAN